jgi:hypothetical protein
MIKFLDFQRTSHLSIYKNQQPKKPLQDVVTRWWSTYRSITRLGFFEEGHHESACSWINRVRQHYQGRMASI